METPHSFVFGRPQAILSWGFLRFAKAVRGFGFRPASNAGRLLVAPPPSRYFVASCLPIIRAKVMVRPQQLPVDMLVYRKLGVHTHQELIDVVERTGREGVQN